MAVMLPAYIDNTSCSAAERKIFESLKRDPDTSHWVVMHSLGIGFQTSGPFGEIDFVIVIPSKGIVCLEIKGGRVSCTNGIWQTTNRYGEREELEKSPILQVRRGMFALREFLLLQFDLDVEDFSCPMGFAVVFPDVACPPLTPEFNRSDVIDIDDLRNPISFAISRVVEKRMRAFQTDGAVKHPNAVETDAIVRFLRPSFDRIVLRSVTLGRTESRLSHLTHEQYARLDELDANPRCLFEGAAGTGKALLALEYSRRAALAESKVLFVCFNRLLGNWIQGQTRHSTVVSGTFHSVARHLIYSSSLANEFQQIEIKARDSGHPQLLFGEQYFSYCKRALQELGSMYEVLVVDEAQDFANIQYFKVLDLALRGGISNGRWAIFGDFTRQAIYGGSSLPISSIRAFGEYFVKARLTRNCRNTRRIAEETCALSGFDKPPFRLADEIGLPVEYRYVKSGVHLIDSLSDVLTGLLNERVSVGDIVLLSPKRFESSGLANVKQIAGLHIADTIYESFDNHRNALRFSTIHAFKGMESQVVIVFDIDSIESDQSQSLLYIAMSRAKSLLIMILNERVEQTINNRMRIAIEKGLTHE